MKSWRAARTTWTGLLIGLLLLGLQACGGGGGGGPAAEGPTGRVAVLLTDGPAEDFDEINVTITRIELLSSSGRVVIFSDPEGVVRNLLSLADESELFAVQTGVPAGRYEKIRLTVSDVELVRPDGLGGVETFHPKLPGNGKIDLNPRQPFFVAPGETLILQLDLDANKSIHIVETGNGQRFNFRPVVFVDVLREMVPGKLVRLRGLVEQKGTDSFVLCPAGADAAAFTDYERFLRACVDVRVSEETSIFDQDGFRVRFEDLAVADEVEAVGRFRSGPEEGGGDYLAVFDAFVVEIGTYLKLKGTVLSLPQTAGGEGTFLFALDRGQGITGNLEVQTHLFQGTRFFSRNGAPLTIDALQIGTRVTIDGVLFLSTPSIGADVLKAALVIVDTSPQGQGDVEGVVEAVVPGERRLDFVGGGCATVPQGARLFRMAQAASADPLVISPIGFGDLAAGQEVKLFGTPVEGECFRTEVGFVLQL